MLRCFPSAFTAADILASRQKAEGDLHELEALFKGVQQQLHLYMAKRRRVVNNLQPIRQLPDELLSRILHFALQNQNLEDYFDRLNNIAQVSSKWAETVSQTPSLWGVANSAKHAPSLDRILARSKSTPLDVVYDTLLRTDSFYESVRPHSHRWRSLSLLGDRAEEASECLLLSLPRLEDFHMFGGVMPEGADFAGERLRHISLAAVGGQWPVATMRNLETIELFRVTATNISTADLFDMLRSSPSLLQLTLHNIDLEPGTSSTSSPSNNPLIPLDQLRRLDIVQLPTLLTTDLLASIRIPRCLHLKVDSNCPAAAHLSCTIRSILENTGALNIDRREDTWRLFSLTSSVATVDVESNVPEVVPWLVGILKSIDRSLSLELLLSCGTPPTPLDDVWLLLNLIPCPITSLELWGPHIEPYVEFLSSPSTVGHSTPPRWPLPRLQALLLTYWEVATPDLLHRTIRNRYQRDGPDQRDGASLTNGAPHMVSESVLGLPKSPSEIRLLRIQGTHGLNREDVGRLQASIGAGKVECDNLPELDDGFGGEETGPQAAI